MTTPAYLSASSEVRVVVQLTIGDPTDPGSEVAFSLETCSIAALLSSITTARDCQSALVIARHTRTDLSVELKEAFSSTLFSIEGTNGQKLDGQGFTLFDRNGHFLADGRFGKEVSSRHDTVD